jgi:hypothetical protein
MGRVIATYGVIVGIIVVVGIQLKSVSRPTTACVGWWWVT